MESGKNGRTKSLPHDECVVGCCLCDGLPTTPSGRSTESFTQSGGALSGVEWSGVDSNTAADERLDLMLVFLIYGCGVGSALLYSGVSSATVLMLLSEVVSS